MPHAVPVACHTPGCPQHLPCPQHSRQTQKSYDTARGSSTARGYGAYHRKWRERILARDPVCRCSGYPGCQHAPGECVEASEIADHVVPLGTRGYSDAELWDERNGKGNCFGCHNRKTATERA